MTDINEQEQGLKKILSQIDWNEIEERSKHPKCVEPEVNEVCELSSDDNTVFVAGAHGTIVEHHGADFEEADQTTAVPWDAERLARNIAISPSVYLPSRELRTRKPVTDAVPILPMLKWGTMPDDPNSQLLECDSRDDLIATITPSFCQCETFSVPMSLIVVGLPDLAEINPFQDWKECELQEQRIIDEIFAAIKEHGMLIRFDQRLLALFLLRVDQFTAGKVCQRIKEAVRRLAFFKLHLDHEPTLRFGVSEHRPGDAGKADRLVREAISNMDLAEHLGGGAIVREVDKNLSLAHVRPSAHFSLGDLLSRQAKQNLEERY